MIKPLVWKRNRRILSITSLLSAPMRDIGKIKISDSILNKPGKLTDENCFTIACNIAGYHHERFDGNGYPDGLKGEDIPLKRALL